MAVRHQPVEFADIVVLKFKISNNFKVQLEGIDFFTCSTFITIELFYIALYRHHSKLT
jgi:hypothetical protein